jgi:Dolichyl-phosphate-mannose-protein mannosyltransferase
MTIERGGLSKKTIPLRFQGTASDLLNSTRLLDLLAVTILAIVAVIAFLTFRDYGLSWDDYTHAQYGELLFAFYASGLKDQRALSWVNLYYYGGGFDLFASALSKVLPLGLFETRRLAGAATGILGLFVTWRTGRRCGGAIAGVIAVALLASCPLYFGHMFMNPKDAPFAAAMAILLCALVRAFQEYPAISLKSSIFIGVGAGLAFGSRVLAGFAAIGTAAVLAFVVTVEAREKGLPSAFRRSVQFCAGLFLSIPLAYAITAVVWPWAALDPVNPLRAVTYFSRFFEKPWSELYAGAITPVTEMPRSYVPTLFAVKLPETFLVLGFGGAVGALAATCKHDISINRRAVFLLISLFALLPLAFTIALRPAMYNGVRHFLFVLPALAVLGGLAGAWIIERTRHIRALSLLFLALLLAALALPVAEMTRLHPYEYTFFNSAFGGVRAARGRYMIDYWGLSLKQASQALLAYLAESHTPRATDRPWKVAVCGPQRSPQVELGRDFAISWEPRGADFALTLGEFYCRKLDAPLVADIVRDGVSYARVYDLRGRSFDTLLTLPGL